MEMEWYRLVIFAIATICMGFYIGRFCAENKASKEIRELKRELGITKIVLNVAMRDNC